MGKFMIGNKIYTSQIGLQVSSSAYPACRTIGDIVILAIYINTLYVISFSLFWFSSQHILSWWAALIIEVSQISSFAVLISKLRVRLGTHTTAPLQLRQMIATNPPSDRGKRYRNVGHYRRVTFEPQIALRW